MNVAGGLFVIAMAALIGHFVLRVIGRPDEPMRQDIEVLRTAVFIYMRHGGEAVEEHIREVLGYGDRE